ncbi:MAG: helicase-associated domain-containing protein [Actinobacteria bacterium]|nr:helicase-associated domain-containing protein [Actinomycetota bacterium]
MLDVNPGFPRTLGAGSAAASACADIEVLDAPIVSWQPARSRERPDGTMPPMTSGPPMTAGPYVTSGLFAEYLSGLDEAALTALLQARPDVRVQPVPRGFPQLAQRLGGADSLAAALRTVNRDTVIVGQAVAALGASATIQGLMGLLGAPEHLVRAGVAELRGLGLAWDHAGVLYLPERLEMHWSAEIGGGRPVAKMARSVLVEDLRTAVGAFGVAAGGLRKPELIGRLSEMMADLPSLAKAVAQLPAPVRERLGAFRRAHQGCYSEFGRSRHRGAGDPTELLLAAGLLLRVNNRPELPREVAVADWLAERELTLTGRPDIPAAGAEDATVRRGAQAAAQDALRAMTTLLDEARTMPIAALKKGGVGPRERVRLAKRLSIPDDVLVVWIDLAYAAGLLADVDAGYAPTPSYAQWRAAQPGRQWALLAHAWFSLEHAPSSRNIDGDREHPPPLPLASAAGLLRRALLPAAHPGASVRAAGEQIDWFCPVHGYDAVQRADRVAAAIREAELLGVIAGDAVSELGAHLLAVTGAEPAEVVAELAQRCASLLPEASCSVILQTDLTAVVSGQPSLAVATLLNECAVAETRGAAGTWRFTPASIRTALDAGWTAEDLLSELGSISARPVPQPLHYLITDAARRHGQVRVRGMRSCVIAEEALITEILHTRSLHRLHFSRLAPTVLSSPHDLDHVLVRLREAGLSPIAEDAHGTVIVEVRPDHQASAPEHAITRKPRPALAAAELARQLAADPQGETRGATADSKTFELLAQLNRHLDDAELELLSDAVDQHSDVCISYRDKNGSRTIRAIQPQQLYGKWLDSWCHLRNGQRDFAIANIESVDPAR